MKKALAITIMIITAVTASSQTLAKDKIYRWRLAETWPSNFPIFGDAARTMVENVKRMSGGRLLISIDSRNKHKSAFGIFDFVKSGQYQMGHTVSYYYKGKDINTLFFTTLPLGMIASEQYAWFYYGGGKELAKKVFDKYGIMHYPGGNTSN